jgi:hypothetical protein
METQQSNGNHMIRGKQTSSTVERETPPPIGPQTDQILQRKEE